MLSLHVPAAYTCRGLGRIGLRADSRTRPPRPASYAISVRQGAGMPPTSFRFHLAVDTLVLGSWLVRPTSIRDFHPKAHGHAGHTRCGGRRPAGYPGHRGRASGHCHVASGLRVLALAPTAAVAAVPDRRGGSPSLGPLGYWGKRLSPEHLVHEGVPSGTPFLGSQIVTYGIIRTCEPAVWGQTTPSTFGLIYPVSTFMGRGAARGMETLSENTP